MNSRPEHFNHDDRVFDDDFRPLSYYEENGLMGSIEVLIHRNGRDYALTVESLPVHLARTQSDIDDGEEETSLSNGSYVINADEIMPSDLRDIKKLPIESLRPFLVEQE